MSSTTHAERGPAAVTLLAARASIIQVLGPLAASPLAIPAVEQMRLTLQRANTCELRWTLRHMPRPHSAPALGRTPYSVAPLQVVARTPSPLLVGAAQIPSAGVPGGLK